MALDDRHPLHLTYRWARRIVVAIVGFTVLLVGLALTVLPGPAFVVIPAGLAILALEFAWARRWLHKLKATSQQLAVTIANGRGKSSSGRAR